MDEQRIYITEKEVSLITRRALSTLRNDRFQRRGINYYKVGKSVRYSRDDVIAYMEARKIMTENHTYTENKQK
jgi:hypothetical protein